MKVADFGVARVKTQTGVMTAETGTYRWMAPEVQYIMSLVMVSISLQYEHIDAFVLNVVH